MKNYKIKSLIKKYDLNDNELKNIRILTRLIISIIMIISITCFIVINYNITQYMEVSRNVINYNLIYLFNLMRIFLIIITIFLFIMYFHILKIINLLRR